MKMILGIDPGSQFLGVGVLEYSDLSEPRYLFSDTLILSPKMAMAERLAEIDVYLATLLQRFSIHQVALEQSFFGKNAHSAFILGQVRGVCMAKAGCAQIPVFEYATRSIKKGVTGSGSATKEQVLSFIRARLRIQGGELTFDAADALAAALYHALTMNVRARMRDL